jgi:hypothetical protein
MQAVTDEIAILGISFVALRLPGPPIFENHADNRQDRSIQFAICSKAGR